MAQGEALSPFLLQQACRKGFNRPAGRMMRMGLTPMRL